MTGMQKAPESQGFGFPKSDGLALYSPELGLQGVRALQISCVETLIMSRRM